MWKKVKEILSTSSKYALNTWRWFNGKKRRIAIISGIIAGLTQEHTFAHQFANQITTGLEVVNQFAEISTYLFAGADILQNSPKAVQKTKDLFIGLRKKFNASN